jgi:hypothetical protein
VKNCLQGVAAGEKSRVRARCTSRRYQRARESEGEYRFAWAEKRICVCGKQSAVDLQHPQPPCECRFCCCNYPPTPTPTCSALARLQRHNLPGMSVVRVSGFAAASAESKLLHVVDLKNASFIDRVKCVCEREKSRKVRGIFAICMRER